MEASNTPGGIDMKITPTMATVAAVFALGGCDRLPPPTPDVTICWAPTTKSSVEGLFQSQVTDFVMDAVRDAAKDGRKDLPSKEEIKQRITVTLDLLHVVGADAAAGSLTCGANMTVKLQRPNGGILSTSGSSPDFRVYKGEKGPVYSVPGPLLLKPLLDKME